MTDAECERERLTSVMRNPAFSSVSVIRHLESVILQETPMPHGLMSAMMAVLLGLAPETPPASGKVFPYPTQTTVLDNGLTILSVPFDSPGIIAYYTVVRTGSRNEVEKGLSGFAHFFEHMMFRGTEKY